MTLKIKFEPRDLWVGSFWEIKRKAYCCDDPNCPSRDISYKELNIKICILPCLSCNLKFRL